MAPRPGSRHRHRRPSPQACDSPRAQPAAAAPVARFHAWMLCSARREQGRDAAGRGRRGPRRARGSQLWACKFQLAKARWASRTSSSRGAACGELRLLRWSSPPAVHSQPSRRASLETYAKCSSRAASPGACRARSPRAAVRCRATTTRRPSTATGRTWTAALQELATRSKLVTRSSVRVRTMRRASPQDHR